MRPRNDAHIIYPEAQFESLRTVYNSKKPAKLKGKVCLVGNLSSNQSTQFPHKRFTAS